jgi:hypothetical protein
MEEEMDEEKHTKKNIINDSVDGIHATVPEEYPCN